MVQFTTKSRESGTNKIIKIIVKTRGFRGHIETTKTDGLNMGRLVLLAGTGEIIPIKQEIIPIKLAKATIGVDISIMSRVQSIRIFHAEMITIFSNNNGAGQAAAFENGNNHQGNLNLSAWGASIRHQ